MIMPVRAGSPSRMSRSPTCAYNTAPSWSVGYRCITMNIAGSGLGTSAVNDLDRRDLWHLARLANRLGSPSTARAVSPFTSRSGSDLRGLCRRGRGYRRAVGWLIPVAAPDEPVHRDEPG